MDGVPVGGPSQSDRPPVRLLTVGTTRQTCAIVACQAGLVNIPLQRSVSILSSPEGTAAQPVRFRAGCSEDTTDRVGTQHLACSQTGRVRMYWKGKSTVSTSTVTRRKGIPGYDAARQVKAMGGPIARRAGRKTAAEPGVSTRKPGSRQPVDDDVREPAEDSPDSEAWTPPRTTFAERWRRMGEERARTAGNVGGDIPRRRTRTTDDITPRRRSSGQLPRGRRHVHRIVPVCVGMLLLVVFYTVCFWVYALGLGISNRISYGPTLTSEVSAVLGQGDSRAHPSSILVSNVGGRIIVTILPGGDATKALVYQAPALEPSMWGNLSDVVATIEVQQHSAIPNIYIHLVGDPGYWHFFARPSLIVTLLNTKQGFEVLVGSQ